MILEEKYNALSDAQKFTLRRKYVALFGTKATFYKKINGKVRLWRAEQIFFENYLTNIAKPEENQDQ
jgi:hypothetical protein